MVINTIKFGVVVPYWQPQVFTGWFKEQTMLVIFSWTPHFPHCSWLKWVHGTIYGKLSLNTKIAGNWMFITQKCCGTEPPNMKNDYCPKIGGCLCQRALLGLWFRVEQLILAKKTIKNRITKKQRQGESPEKTNKEQKKNKTCMFMHFPQFVFFFLFALVLFFSICYFFIKRYILRVAGLRMLGSSPLFSGNKSESLRQLVTNKLECIKWGNIPISFVPVRCWNFRCGAIYCPQESVPNDVQTSSWWILMENFTIYLTTPDISHGKPSI